MTSLMAESSTGAREEAGIPEIDDPFNVTTEDGGFLWFDKDKHLASMAREGEFEYSVGQLKNETMIMASEEG